MLDRAYRETATIGHWNPIQANNIIPKLLERVRPVHEVVKVDYYLQGCPPAADDIHQLLMDLLDGKEPSTEKRRFG